MRGPPSEFAAPPIYYYPDVRKPRIRFSRTEVMQLLVAILALSLAFTVLQAFSISGGITASIGTLGLVFLVSLVAVATGVGVHEIAHKIAAQRYGHWAEFRYNLMGLMLAFVFAFMGFLFGAPGATWISGNVTRAQNGRISAAGPASNILMGGAFFAAALLVGPAAQAGSLAIATLASTVQFAAYINGILAGFNMIPLMPLDGAKVWKWNKAAYAGILAAAVLLIVAWYVYGVPRF